MRPAPNLDHLHADCRCGAAYGSHHRKGCLSLPEGECDECGAEYGGDHDAGCPEVSEEQDPDDLMDLREDRLDYEYECGANRWGDE